MLTLVKSLKTLVLSDRMDWTTAKNRIIGVTNLDDTTFGMSFRIQGHGHTRIYAKNFSKVVTFMTLHDSDRVQETMEKSLMDKILAPISENKSYSTRTIKTIHNYFVFRADHGEDINNVILEYSLRMRGIDTIMDFNIHNAMVAKVCGVTWHFFNSGKVLAIIGGCDLRQAREMVRLSWQKIRN